MWGSSQELDSGPFIFYDSSLENIGNMALWAWFSTTFLPELPDLRQPPSYCGTEFFCSHRCPVANAWNRGWRSFPPGPGEDLVYKITMYTVYPKHARNFHIETNIGCNYTSSKPSFFFGIFYVKFRNTSPSIFVGELCLGEKLEWPFQ